MRIKDLLLESSTEVFVVSNNKSFEKSIQHIQFENLLSGFEKQLTKCPINVRIILELTYYDESSGSSSRGSEKRKTPPPIDSSAINILAPVRSDSFIPISLWRVFHDLSEALFDPKFSGTPQATVDFRNIVEDFIKENYTFEKNSMTSSTSDEQLFNRLFGNKRQAYHTNDHVNNSDTWLSSFLLNIMTMKSARDARASKTETLAYRIFSKEELCEISAQYLFSGKIKFNPLPQIYQAHESYTKIILKNPSQVQNLSDQLADLLKKFLYDHYRTKIGETYTIEKHVNTN